MLIVDKPMPTNCCECALDCCWVEGTMPFEYAEKRKPDCPIKGELPDEHGDLIDKDEMHKKIRLWKSTATDTITMGFLYYFEKLLMAERPIIAAERKDDGTTVD